MVTFGIAALFIPYTQESGLEKCLLADLFILKLIAVQIIAFACQWIFLGLLNAFPEIRPVHRFFRKIEIKLRGGRKKPLIQ